MADVPARGAGPCYGCPNRQPAGRVLTTTSQATACESLRVAPAGDLPVHILTKVFVLFAAVLSLLLAALTIPFAYNANAINEAFLDERDAKDAALGQLQAQSTAFDAELSRVQGEIATIQNDLAQREAEINDLRSENTRLLTDKRNAENARDAIAGQVDQFGETIKTQTELVANYRAEITALRDAELRFRREKLQLEDRVNDLESNNEVLTQTQRALQEQLAEAREAMDSGFSSRSGSGATSGEPFVYSGPAIVGRVREVERDDATGELLARVDLGQNDQVRENMKLFITRGDEQFLANLVVVETDLEWSVGRIDTLGTNNNIRPGDIVRSTLQ